MRLAASLLLALALALAASAAGVPWKAGEVDSLSLQQARRAMWRSVALDGWGQAANGDWLKAALFSGAEIAIVSGAVSQHNEWRRWQDRRRALTDESLIDAYVAREDFYLRDRNKLLWWWLWLKLAAVLDAYVSGALSNFDAGWQAAAPSPPGTPSAVLRPALLPGGAPGLELRLTLP